MCSAEMSTKLVKFRVNFVCRVFEKLCKTKLANMESSEKKIERKEAVLKPFSRLDIVYAVLKLLLFIYFIFKPNQFILLQVKLA